MKNNEAKKWFSRFKEAACITVTHLALIILDLILYEIWYETDLSYALELWIGDYTIFDIIAAVLLLSFFIRTLHTVFRWMKENMYSMTKEELESLYD